jgi:hypothetical protein
MSSEYDRVKRDLEEVMLDGWGERCETKDTDDFPDIADDPESWGSRCPVCLIYEKIDELFELLEPDEDDL